MILGTNKRKTHISTHTSRTHTSTQHFGKSETKKKHSSLRWSVYWNKIQLFFLHPFFLCLFSKSLSHFLSFVYSIFLCVFHCNECTVSRVVFIFPSFSFSSPLLLSRMWTKPRFGEKEVGESTETKVYQVNV